MLMLKATQADARYVNVQRIFGQGQPVMSRPRHPCF
jgi:hypothetical protein